DKFDPKARAHIAAMAHLVGAVRLPQGAMSAAAGTEVVVDILFLQKRRGDQDAAGPAWDALAEAVPADDGEDALLINRYFLDHPDGSWSPCAHVERIRADLYVPARLFHARRARGRPARRARRSAARDLRACRERG